MDMIFEPMDILKQYPVRRSKGQKQGFRNDIRMYASGLGYPVTVERGKRDVHNIIIGNPKTAEYLITAHYDTPAVLLFPNLLMPTNKLLHWLYQIVVILSYMLLALLICLPVAVLTEDSVATFLVWYAAYMLLVFLGRIGPANKNNYNDNTSGIVTLLETARSMPASHRKRVCFILFDQEKMGCVGSAAYRKTHKEESEKQLVINMDCVGDGDELLIFPMKSLKTDEEAMNMLRRMDGQVGKKNITLLEEGFFKYPSDQKNFPRSVTIAAFHWKKWIGYYHGRIHTRRDTVLDYTNINILRAALVSLICNS